MKILITGGAGFIGSHLSVELQKQGHEVTVIDILSPQIHGKNPEDSPLFRSIKDKVNFVRSDIRNKEILSPLIEKTEVVIHLVAETGTGQSMYEIERYTNVNVVGLACLLDCLANTPNHVKKLVLSSSRAVYGEGKYQCEKDGFIYPDARKIEHLKQGIFEILCPKCGDKARCVPTDEQSELKPQSLYALNKRTQEELVSFISETIGIPSILLRYQNVYGPGQSLTNPYTGILSIFSTQLRLGNDLNIFEDGQESRDFVYIDDVVNATILACMDKTFTCQTYNVGSGERQTVLQIAELLKTAYQSKSKITVSGNFRIGDIRHNIANISAIKKNLNFFPRVSFKEGITKYVDWVKGEDLNDNQYQKSLEEMKKRGLLQ